MVGYNLSLLIEIGLMYLSKSGGGADRLPASLPGSEGSDSVKSKLKLKANAVIIRLFSRGAF